MSKKILIFGGSGFLGNALYKELNSYFDTYATFNTHNSFFEKNQKFYAFNFETEPVAILLSSLKPDIIISCVRGNFNSQVQFHLALIDWIKTNKCKFIFLSSSNVFDSFHHYPSYEYDKTFSESSYGRFKIKIENALLRLPTHKYVIARLPMIFGHGSPRIQELKQLQHLKAPIEVFPNVILNATTVSKFTQQLHYIINRNRKGVFHLGSKDLIHHYDLIKEITEELGLKQCIFKQVYNSNNDRYLAVLPKDNLLPKYLQFTINDVVKGSLKI
ncbi:sugar nucleotide-binding protein [Aquimarina agarilytica]|uniref:sugar nucleotide-binding protein n=1 Tax=Aquimarina agarilytica TaxID=1087449 RepID=UPI00028816F9|nr:sugar nucleotide-binding protein [Aquimarina agarilytica]